ERHSTPGLFDRLSRADPTFPISVLDDRGILIATRYLLEHEKPDLMLVHIADLDGEQHETGAFSRHARAVLEYQDQLLGQRSRPSRRRPSSPSSPTTALKPTTRCSVPRQPWPRRGCLAPWAFARA